MSHVQIDFNGKLLDFLFREESLGDKGVLQQEFGNLEYRIDCWQQGKAVHELHERISESGQSLVIDAGANIGASAVWFFNAFEGAFLFCVEPEPKNFGLLEQNTKIYEEKFNFHGALSDRDGKARVIDPGLSDWGFQTVDQRDASPSGAGPEVPAICPFSILRHPKAVRTRPLIFKIDIEGGERRLFSGDVSWMRSFPLIIIELHDWLLPFSGNSRNFLHALAQYEFDVLQKGENMFLFNREILSS